jgi:hypothetical protein
VQLNTAKAELKTAKSNLNKYYSDLTQSVAERAKVAPDADISEFYRDSYKGNRAINKRLRALQVLALVDAGLRINDAWQGRNPYLPIAGDVVIPVAKTSWKMIKNNPVSDAVVKAVTSMSISGETKDSSASESQSAAKASE